ncbi:oligosaccharide flippase family protein [Glaciecola sp. SC05]|uniref:oligosaccharide flippase family protein n=1 Tax=Glaciecola sp. SC05 TaxID=1987355 RepID=UPI0035284009
MSELKKGVTSSLLLVVDSILKKLVGLVSTLILARLLLPEDFGIIAIATLMVGFIEILSNTGTNQYLLIVDELDDEKVNTAWTLNLILKSTMSVIMIIATFFIADYYDDPRLIDVLLSLTLVFFSYSFQNPGLAYLKRAQNYTPIVKLGVFVKVVSVAAAIIAAFTLQSYWALIIGKAISAPLMIVGSYMIQNHRPKLNMTNAKQQWQFSGWIIPQSIFGYVRTQLDTLLVSSAFGQSQLGSYHTMKYIAFIPSGYVILPVIQPFLVELRKVKNIPAEFAKQFNASFFVTLLLGAPISAVMYFHHELVTAVLLGQNWIKYSNLLGAFGLLIPSFIMLNQATRVLMLHGKTKQIFFYECIAFAILYSTLFWVGLSDIMIFTYVRVGMESIICSAFLIFILLRYTSLKNTISLLLGLIPFAVGIYVANIATTIIPFQFENVFLQLCLITGIFYIVFYGFMLTVHLMFLRTVREWAYLETLVLRIIKPVFEKVKG